MLLKGAFLDKRQRLRYHYVANRIKAVDKEEENATPYQRGKPRAERFAWKGSISGHPVGAVLNIVDTVGDARYAY